MRSSRLLAVWLGDAGVRGGARSVPAFARLVGAKRRQAYYWLTGEWMPDLVSVDRIRRALGVSADKVVDACLAARQRRKVKLELETVRRLAELK